MTAQNAFEDKANETLEEKALRVCEVIVSQGLGVHMDGIVKGKDFRTAEIAVINFFNEDLKLIRTHNEFHTLPRQAADFIRAFKLGLRGDQEFQGSLMALMARDMIISGWQTKAKPLHLDLNSDGGKRALYVEPTGLVAEFVEAFDIGYKTLSTPQPKTPTGAK